MGLALVLLLAYSLKMQGSLHTLASELGKLEGEIIGFSGDQAVCERLHEMGLHQGVVLKVVGRAPWKGPWLVQFKTTCIALRIEEAACPIIKLIQKN